MEDRQVEKYKWDEKKLVLVVEDEEINRQILGEILRDTYKVLFAGDGEEALQVIEKNKKVLSLVILDLIMPHMSGMEVLEQIKSKKEYEDIPVIVASGDQSQEIECLDKGANDFIQKPYPEAGVILARVKRAVELFESRHIIRSTERDPLTGLYNREFFYSYAEQFDYHHPDTEMDAIQIDINHFSMINERYGCEYGDEILIKVGQKAREMVHDDGGIVSRHGADVFLIYCPHRDDYKAMLDNISQDLVEEKNSNNRVRVRMGVYSNVDRTLEMEHRFDRAKMAADTVRGSYTRSIGVYDDTLHKSELYHLRLIEEFPIAIRENQFKVYYQPKYDIRFDKPILFGAEALVRWQHPELGMISPGIFIPLFEENGLIQSLDHYVWRVAARQIREWKDTLDYSIPVSVNVSRIDMTDAGLVDIFKGILEEFSLEPEDLHLEVTESAYAEDSDQIIDMVKQLRSVGFQIEMDDFGSGYSSLNMISTLPIDILKLDMKFIQTASVDEKNMRMIGIIVEIARHLAVPVVAEGVETAEQLEALKKRGCDIVQGYYFSPPVPADKFQERLENERDGVSDITEEEVPADSAPKKERFSFTRRWAEKISIPMHRTSVIMVIIAFIIAGALYVVDTMVTRGYRRMEEANNRYITVQNAADDLEMASDDMTANVRNFVVNGNYKYLEEYFEEADVVRRRDRAVANLQDILEGYDDEALEYLSTALDLSNELMNQEYIAMRLILSSGDYDDYDIPEVLQDISLTEDQEAMSPDARREEAINLVLGEEYNDYKTRIKENANLCTEDLVEKSDVERVGASNRLNILVGLQTILTAALLIVIVLMVLLIDIWILRPLKAMMENMKNKELIEPAGAEEIRFVTETYNSIFEENRRTHEYLTYGNMHDALTGLYNRSAYNMMKKDLDMSKNALLLVDVDKFKSVNDTYGHDVGDQVLKKVAEVLEYSFRATDLVFRLGGDEFVVIMMNVDSKMRKLVRNKIEQANVMLQQPSDDLPPTSLSVGVAFADRENPEGDIFNDADVALYRMKESGRCGCYIY